MKKTFSGLCLLVSAFCAFAAPEEFVTKAASGTTSATVYFEPGPAGALVVADVTSDKAASVLSWRLGAAQLTLLAAAAADTTNLLVTVGTVASNAAIVSVTAAGVVTPHAAFTNSFVTNAIVYLENPIGTNVTTTSLAREVTSSFLPILSVSSTNVVSVVSNAASVAALAIGTNFLFTARPDQLETNQVASWVTNSGNLVVTLSNNWSFAPQKAFVLTTNLYTVPFAASATDTSIILVNSNGLAAADQLLILPSTGGASLLQINRAAPYRWQYQTIKAVTGLALGAGDRLFVLDTAITTPVGAATLRLMADPVRVLPANVPAVLSVDGTSAVAINAATVRYK
jgi:hypothetical protein